MSAVRTIRLELSRAEAEELARTLREAEAAAMLSLAALAGPAVASLPAWWEADALRVRRLRLTGVLGKLESAAGVPLRGLGL